MLLNAYKVMVNYDLKDGSEVAYSTIVASSTQEYAEQKAVLEGQSAWRIWDDVVAYRTQLKKMNYMIDKEDE